MAVRIRLKRLGRRHRPFFRICAMDSRSPRDGRVIEELGHYDPMVPETDARAVLKAERIDYWLSVGAKPSEKVAVLIKKYGTGGTHQEKQQQALQRLAVSKPTAPPPVIVPRKKQEEPAAEETVTDEQTSEEPTGESQASEPQTETTAEAETAAATATDQSSQ